MAYIEEYKLKDGEIRYRARTRTGGRDSKMVSGKVTGRKIWAKDKADELERYRLMGDGELKPQNTKIIEVFKHYVSHCKTEILRRKLKYILLIILFFFK